MATGHLRPWGRIAGMESTLTPFWKEAFHEVILTVTLHDPERAPLSATPTHKLPIWHMLV